MSVDKEFSIASIGTFRSCFLTKNGTPRQPSVCPYARGSVAVSHFNNPDHSLESLSDYSHVWLIFIFHENSDSKIKAKVCPPRLNGGKVGVFASRSPHRPNNIGMSLVQVERVENGTLFVTGADLIDGTPIIDIKPYIEYCDRPCSSPSCPDWISNPPSAPLTVDITHGAKQQIQVAPLRFLRSAAELEQCIRDVLVGDPRSVYRKRQGEVEFSFPVDAVDVRVQVGAEGGASVVDVRQTDFVRNLLLKNGA